MTKRIVLVLLVLALVAVAGNIPKVPTYSITLVKSAVVSGTVLKAGDYKLLLRDSKASLVPRDGGPSVETTVRVETAPSKFDNTEITFQSESSKNVISEIDLGGSKIKLIFAQ